MKYQGNKKYTNGEITVFWYPKKCVHATTCYRELIEVFNPRKRPWVNMNGAPTSEIIRVVEKCPTQALAFRYNSELENGAPDENTVSSAGTFVTPAEVPVPEARVMRDGPLLLKGNFTLIGTDGKELEHRRIISICRCNESKALPFCDGMHRKTGYQGD